MREVQKWTIFELNLSSLKGYDNPIQDVILTVEFKSPSDKLHKIRGFWDGGNNWKVRFSPDEEGTWGYISHCSDETDHGLEGHSGTFVCLEYDGDNPLYVHGDIRISKNRRYLCHADGTPFFWLSDTAWNGVLLSTEQDWEDYLLDRSKKGFTAVQFVTTQWRAATADIDGRRPYTGTEKISIDPIYYQRMDKRIDALNRHGIVAAPVLLWAISAETDPGLQLPDDQAILLSQYMVARYGAHKVVWILGGDGNYLGERAERWRKLGRAIFSDDRTYVVTMHPCGMSWVADEFRNEPWFSFNGYQSGHGDNDEALRWLTQGPPSQDWKKEPHVPEINLEPNYEAHLAYQSRRPFDDFAVRRAAYWSLLVAPTAGVSYGAHGIWSWQTEPGEPLNHKGTGTARPWHEAINLPGSTNMKFLKDFFSSMDWWKLMPKQDLLLSQPGEIEPRRFVTVSLSEDSSFLVAYIPESTKIILNLKEMGHNLIYKWYNPRNGQWSVEGKVDNCNYAQFTSPDDHDWLLYVQRADN